MITKIKTENERIEEDIKSLAEYGKLLEEHKKWVFDRYGEWTDKDKYNFERWF